MRSGDRGGNRLLVELFRYTLVGGLAFLVDVVVLYVFVEFVGLHYLISGLVGFCAGLTTNYLLSIWWVFQRRSLTNPYAEFVMFTILGVVGIGLNELCLYVFTGFVGLHYLTSKLIATGVTYAWNFTSRKLLLFSGRLRADVDRGAPVPEASASGTAVAGTGK